jgi:hypothetical protein
MSFSKTHRHRGDTHNESASPWQEDLSYQFNAILFAWAMFGGRASTQYIDYRDNGLSAKATCIDLPPGSGAAPQCCGENNQ